MKKAVLLSLLFVFLSATAASAAPTVLLNGQRLSFDVPPVIQDGTTLVPLRAIFEPLGADVRWEPQTRTVTVQKGDTHIILAIDRAEAWVNGRTVALPVPAQTIDGRTMVPLRFVSTALGADVGWDPATQTITITSEVSTTHAVKSEAKVHFIDVGQGESIYIQLPDHYDILIDGGNKVAGETVVDYLRSQRVDDIELLIATYPDEDHMGGLMTVLDQFKVERVIDSGPSESSELYSLFNSKMGLEGCQYDADKRQTIVIGDAKFEVLTGTETWDGTQGFPVVCRLDTGDIEFLFTGDTESLAEAALSGSLDAEILKVGNHGGLTSSSAAFLSRVKPQVAVISVGQVNPYGYPDAGTLRRLESAGAKIYRTDRDGTIVVTTDGTEFSVK